MKGAFIMKKRLLALVLAMLMTVSALTACSGAAEEGSGTASTAAKADTGADTDAQTDKAKEEVTKSGEEEDIAEITISYWSQATVPDAQNLDMVEDAINAITEEKINTTVHLNIMDAGTYIPNGAMANGVANGEDYDLVLTAAALSGHYSVMSSNGMLMPLNDLLEEYAPELLEIVPKDFYGATTKNGQILAIPSYCNKVKNLYWACRDEVLEGIGLKIEDIKTVEDIDAALKKIHEVFPDMIPLGGASSTLNVKFPGYANAGLHDMSTYDTLGESTAVAAAVYYDDTTLTAVCRYETDDFKADMELVKKWYDLGYVDKDVVTDKSLSNALREKANVASCFFSLQEDLADSYCENTSVAKLASPYIGTGVLQQFTWAIPVSCDEPEAAAKFMNLLYTDANIVNLINYGIEGIHYEFKEDGTIGFLEGMTAETDGYFMGGNSKLIGNGFLAYIWEGANPEANKLGKAEMDHAKYSPLLGFSLDTSDPAIEDVYTMIAPMANQEYGPALFCGSAKDGYYEEFIQKMYDAGLQQYLDGVNAQIQAWLAENK